MTIGEAFLQNRLSAYFMYRLRWTTAFLGVQLVSHVIEITLYQQLFNFSFFGSVVLVKTLSYLGQDFWWWSLEPLRREIRDVGETNLAEWWQLRKGSVLRPLSIAVTGLVAVAAILFCKDFYRNEWILAPHLLFVPMYLVVLALQLIYQSALALLQANRRIYRIPAVFVLPDLLFFIVPVTLMHNPQPWPLFFVFFGSRLAQFGLSSIFLVKAFRELPSKSFAQRSGQKLLSLPPQPLHANIGFGAKTALIGPVGALTLLFFLVRRFHWHQDFYSIFILSLPIFNRASRLTDPLLFDLIRLDRGKLQRLVPRYLTQLGRFLCFYSLTLWAFVGAVSWWSLRDFNAATIVTGTLVTGLLWLSFVRLRVYLKRVRPIHRNDWQMVKLRIAKKSATVTHALRLYAGTRGLTLLNVAEDKFVLHCQQGDRANTDAILRDLTLIGAGLLRLTRIDKAAVFTQPAAGAAFKMHSDLSTRRWHARAWAEINRFDKLAIKRVRVGPVAVVRDYGSQGEVTSIRVSRVSET